MITLNFMPYPHYYETMILIARIFNIFGIILMVLGSMSLSFKGFDFILCGKEIIVSRFEVVSVLSGFIIMIIGGYGI